MLPVVGRRAVTAAGQAVLGALLLFTGTAHLTFARAEFRAQVPQFVPLDADTTVLAVHGKHRGPGSRTSRSRSCCGNERVGRGAVAA